MVTAAPMAGDEIPGIDACMIQFGQFEVYHGCTIEGRCRSASQGLMSCQQS
jgi:hypothetical protein